MAGFVPAIHALLCFLGAAIETWMPGTSPGMISRTTGRAQICRSTIFSLSSAIASDGLRPFGQAFAQFMMVWQR
jgi:hypothetical protein